MNILWITIYHLLFWEPLVGLEGFRRRRGVWEMTRALAWGSRSTQSGREIGDVVTKLLSNRREGDQALTSGPN